VPETSIVILTKNAGKQFKQVLEMIFSQAYRKFEVIIIDSGSTDGTLEIASRFKARIVRINPDDFGHGRTRNMGARLAKGKFVVFVTQDALPGNQDWLGALVKSMEKDVAGAYSRQIPKKGTSPMEDFFLRDKYRGKRIVRRGKGKNMDDIHFSDRSSCVRRDLLVKYPYAEDLVLAEDQKWAKQMLEMNHVIVYEPASVVYHSHNYSLVKVFKKWFDVGSAFRRIGKSESSTGFLVGKGMGYYWREFTFLLVNHPLWIPYAVIYDFLKLAGFLVGKMERMLPHWMKKHLSLYSLHWRTMP